MLKVVYSQTYLSRWSIICLVLIVLKIQTQTAVECPLSGTATLPDGSTVYWAKDETAETITLTVTDASGSITQLVVPVGDFKF